MVRNNKIKFSGKQMLQILMEENGTKYTVHRTKEDKSFDKFLKREYNITSEEYFNMFDSQKNLCKICGAKPSKKRLAIDHCHVTGRVRGLLCQSCNWGLGHFKDNPKLLENALEYLRYTPI